MKKSLARLAVTALLATGVALPAATSANAAPVKYPNCTALNKKYPHGVKKSAATKDSYVSKGRKATRTSAATVDAKTYATNARLDADKDGIACEK